MTTKTKTAAAADVEHLEGCPAVDGRRIERYVVADPDDRAVTVTRCLTCGADRYDREPIPTGQDGMSDTAAALLAGDERYQELWHTDPSAIYRGLTDDERRDPRLNPQHQFAESEAPGVRNKRTLA